MFTIRFQPTETMDKSLTTTIKKIRSWLYSKYIEDPQSQYLFKPWLFSEGSWRPQNLKAVTVTTTSLQDPDNSQSSKYWAMRLEHPDSNNTFRIWRTDIGITIRDSNHIDVVICVSYYMQSGYLGTEPDDPPISTPRIVSELMSIPYTTCLIGNTPISTKYNTIEIGLGRMLVEQIMDKKRICPIVVVRADSTNNYNVSPRALFDAIKGNAVMYLLPNDMNILDEIKYYFGKSYHTLNIPLNSIRIYTNVNVTNPIDYKNHRFFHLSDSSSNEVIQEIAKGLYRITPTTFTDRVSSLDDVNQKLKETKFLARLSKSNKDSDEFAKMAELEIEENNDLKAMYSSLAIELENCQIEAKQWKEKYASMKNEKEAVTTQNEILSEKSSAIKKCEETLSNFTKLPKTAEAILAIISNIYSDKLLVLPEAIKSAKNYSGNHIDDIWELFFLFPTKLYDLLFESAIALDCVKIQNEFKNNTRFELTFTEGSFTKKHSKIMKERFIEHNGQTFNITPHAKIKSSSDQFRIHFCVDQKKKKLVIGFFGKHLSSGMLNRFTK